MSMNDNRFGQIREIVENLDTRVSKEGAVVQFDMYGGGPDEAMIKANRLGYLRLGIEFLKAAFALPAKDAHGKEIDVNIDYLTDEDNPIRFDWFERREDLKPIKVEDTSTLKHQVKDTLRLIGCGTLSLTVLLLIIAGIWTVISWIK